MQVFDKETFNELMLPLGNNAIQDILSTYFKYIDKYFEDIEKSVKERNMEDIFFYAHRIKGNVGAICGEKTFQLARKLEKKGIDNDDEGIDELLAEFKIELKLFNKEIKKYADNLKEKK